MFDLIFPRQFFTKMGSFVLIRKEKARTFQNSPYFCLQATSGAVYCLLNKDHSFFGDTLYSFCSNRLMYYFVFMKRSHLKVRGKE